MGSVCMSVHGFESVIGATVRVGVERTPGNSQVSIFVCDKYIYRVSRVSVGSSSSRSVCVRGQPKSESFLPPSFARTLGWEYSRSIVVARDWSAITSSRTLIQSRAICLPRTFFKIASGLL